MTTENNLCHKKNTGSFIFGEIEGTTGITLAAIGGQSMMDTSAVPTG